MDTLVELIKTLESNEHLKSQVRDRMTFITDDEFMEALPNDVEVLVEKVVSECSAQLIQNNGAVNHTKIDLLQAKTGRSVTPGETDSFGWLTGVLNTTVGRVVFG